MPDSNGIAVTDIQDPMSKMIAIANGDLSSFTTDSNKSVDRSKAKLRMFLVATAERELNRIIPLTKTLDDMLDIYQKKSMEVISTTDNNDATVAKLAIMIDVVTKSLDRSINLVRQMASDEKLLGGLSVDLSSININLNTSDNANPQAVVNSFINTPNARNNVREAVKLITKIIEEDSIKESDIVDIEVTEVTEEDNQGQSNTTE